MADRVADHAERAASFGFRGDGARQALEHLIGGDLLRCEAWCERVLLPDVGGAEGAAPIGPGDEQAAAALLAAIAALQGDVDVVRQLGESVDADPSDGIEAAAVVSHLLDLHDAAAPPAEVDAPTASSVSDRATDRSLGDAALVLLADGGSPTDRDAADRDALLTLLSAAVAADRRVSVTVLVSFERAIGAELARRNQPAAALDVLTVAEQRWRENHAHAELAEVLIALADLNATTGRRSIAERQASEAYVLAERLGVADTKQRALALHHESTPLSRDLGHPDERMVLMSDVVGSTKVSELDGDAAYFDLVMAHHDTVQALLAEHGGTEFSEGGDSLLAWFESPEDSLDCALAILDTVAGLHRTGPQLQVRISIAGGRPFFRRGRPYGSVVNRAARINGRGEPGQIVVDAAALTRLAPVVDGFAAQTIDLDDIGTEMIGVLTR